MTLDEMAQDVVNKAKQVLEACAKVGDDFQHVAFPLTVGEGKIGFGIVPLSGDKAERRQEITNIHESLEHNGCNALVIISDAWATSVPAGMTATEALEAKDAGQLIPKEGLITLVCSQEGPAKTITNLYRRVGNKIEWEKQEEVMEFDSWMVPPQWLHTVSKGEA